MTNRYSLRITAFAAFAVLAACSPATETEPPAEASDPADAVEPINESSVETEVEEQPASDTADAAPETDASASEPAHEDEAHADDETHAHGEAHVHGEAELAIAINGDNLSVSFESPLVNLVGFEHEPNSDETSAAYNDMRDALANSDSVLSFSDDAECAHYSSETSIRRSGDHATMIADYEFTCDRMGKLGGGKVAAFENFDGLEEINLVVVSQSQQSVAFLTATNSSFTIGQ